MDGTPQVIAGRMMEHKMRTTGNYRHGFNDHPAYRVWTYMKSRCYNPNDTAYHNYGGRGITVCDQWVESPNVFMEWALSNGWAKGLFIDRIDVGNGYSPDNCRFVTPSVSSINQRKRKDNSSGFRGVNYHQKKRKWVSRLQVGGKRKHIGEFKSMGDAIFARDEFIKSHNLPHVLSDGGA